MVRLEETIEVAQPLEDVFRYISDFRTIPEWDPGIVAAEKETPGPVGEGTVFSLEVSFWGRSVPMTYTIKEFSPPFQVVLEGDADNLHAIDTITFVKTAQGTHIRYVAELSMLGLGAWFEPLLKPLLVRMGRKTAKGIRKALSAGNFSPIELPST